MHSVCVSSQVLFSVIFIAVHTNTENFKFFLHLYSIIQAWCALLHLGINTYKCIHLRLTFSSPYQTYYYSYDKGCELVNWLHPSNPEILILMIIQMLETDMVNCPMYYQSTYLLVIIVSRMIDTCCTFPSTKKSFLA